MVDEAAVSCFLGPGTDEFAGCFSLAVSVASAIETFDAATLLSSCCSGASSAVLESSPP